MEISRRELLVGMGAGAVSVLAPVSPWSATASAAPVGSTGRTRAGLDLATATADTFRPHVGSRFRLQRSGQRALDLTLSAVNQRPAADDGTDSFSLLFSAAQTAGLGQATYQLDHSVLGSFNLFVVPVGTGGLTAVVNHLVS